MNAHERAGLDLRMGALSGASGRIIGMETFGASAPLKALQKRFGFEPDRVALVSQELLGRVMHECR